MLQPAIAPLAAAILFASARAAMAAELAAPHVGGATVDIEFDLVEYRFGKDEDSYLVESTASYGDDTNRVVLKLDGGGSVGRRMEAIEAQLLYARAIGGNFQVQLGVRHDLRPHPHNSYAVAGIEGEAASGLDVEAVLFLSDDGNLFGGLKAVYESEIFPALVVEPRVEVHYVAQDVPRDELATGFTDAEFGLRLKYALTEHVAPYVGVSYERLLGDTADLARAAGDETKATNFVVGLSAAF